MYQMALVTGASSGLGKAFADMLGSEGISVWATARDVNRIQKSEHILPFELNLLDDESISKFLEKIKNEDLAVDLLINNAGAGALYEFERFPESAIRDQIDLLFYNQIRITQALYQKMLRRGKGTIVNVSSMAAEYGVPYMSLYNATKAGLTAFSKSLMLETSQIVVIDLQPGDFNTPFNVEQNSDISDQANRAYEAMIVHTKSHPEASTAAQQLKRILKKNASGTYRIGAFSQTKLYPFLLRLLPQNLVRFILKRYYKMK